MSPQRPRNGSPNSLGGKGNVFLINGIPGLAPTAARHQAALDVLSNFPNIKVIGEVEGQWTPSVVKTNTLKFLATHPQQIDGVVDSGLGAVSAWQAFEQSGRPLPKINGFVGECSYLAYVKEKAPARLFDVAGRRRCGVDRI